MMERVLGGGMCTTKQRQRMGGRGLFAKQMVRRGSKWQANVLTAATYATNLVLLNFSPPPTRHRRAPRCLAGDKFPDARK